MRYLLTGGSAAGKSTFAKKLARRLSNAPVYISAGRDDSEAQLRDLQGFEVVCRFTDIGGAELPHGSTVVLECLCKLTANELFGGAGERAADAVCEGVLRLAERAEHLIVVTNEVGSDGARYKDSVQDYTAALGEINRRLASRFDNVYEFCCAMPVALKGGLIGFDEEGSGGSVILVVGGMASGKREFVRDVLGFPESDMSCDIQSACPVLLDLQQLVQESPESSMDLLPRLLEKKVVICNEVGSGIIPVEEELVEWRVATGQLCNALAQSADKVIRVSCGLPIYLKGSGDFAQAKK